MPADSSAVSQFESLVKGFLPNSNRLVAALEFARAVASKASIFAPLYGGTEGLIAKAQAAYDEYCAPYDIKGLKDDTEAAIDVAAKLIMRDVITGAAEAIS